MWLRGSVVTALDSLTERSRVRLPATALPSNNSGHLRACVGARGLVVDADFDVS